MISGKHFQIKITLQIIQKVKGAGNSYTENTYNIIHRDYESGINYYRLKQVGFDGTINEHDIISTDKTLDRILLKRVNSMGQEVNESYKGVVFEYYSDGHVKQVFQK